MKLFNQLAMWIMWINKVTKSICCKLIIVSKEMKIILIYKISKLIYSEKQRKKCK